MWLIAPLLRPLIFGVVAVIDFIERIFAHSENLYKLLLVRGFERFRWGIGVWRAWHSYYHAYRRVPAYRDYINAHGGKPRISIRHFMPVLDVIPETDKENYVKKYPLEARVLGGVLPLRGVMVDESSGSSGTPVSWVRGPIERQMIKQMLQLSFHRTIGERKVFVLNAFALGAWSTGLSVSMGLTDISIIKSTGPNLDKIVTTMLDFGPSYHYLITGYPPFLKTLSDDPRIDWSKYSVDVVYGGEGISESLRDYLLKRFKRVIGSYGASDLEINMAAESDLSISLRKAILTDERLREALTRTAYGVSPMILQYNPLAYYMEENVKGELVLTLARPYNISPKIRYNIHDRGHVLRYPDLKSILKKCGRMDLLKAGHIDLPFLFIYGRSDMSIEYYGAKIAPDALREILYAIEELAPILNTFKLLSREDERHNKKMEVAVELVEGAQIPGDIEKLGKEIFERLGAMNNDFYNAMHQAAAPDNKPSFTLHSYGTGPFEGGQKKLKAEYVSTNIVYDKLL